MKQFIISLVVLPSSFLLFDEWRSNSSHANIHPAADVSMNNPRNAKVVDHPGAKGGFSVGDARTRSLTTPFFGVV